MHLLAGVQDSVLLFYMRVARVSIYFSKHIFEFLSNEWKCKYCSLQQYTIKRDLIDISKTSNLSMKIELHRRTIAEIVL